METNGTHQASFRDPSGYVFYENSQLKRAITPHYFKQYHALKEKGIFKTLIKNKLLIPHTETAVSQSSITLTPTVIPFITNPYEWSFEQYKHAALHTLKIHKYLLSKGFILKDASAYNVTFYQGKPIFIDTLSFDFYEENKPWRGYRQFISHFLGPLVLAKYHGSQLFKMMQTHIDGIPVEVIASLLPLKTKFNPTLFTNIHLLANAEKKHSEDYEVTTKAATLSKKAQLNIIDSLYNYIKKLEHKEKTEWGDYYSKINYSSKSFTTKETIIQSWVKDLSPQRLIDMGGNDGTFARTVLHTVPHVIVTDIDPLAVEKNYKTALHHKETNILAFVCDVLQPSAGIGFNNVERTSLLDRLKSYAPDVTMALALIHHITLSGNIPFEKSASFFAAFSKTLIIEFPKRKDSWVVSLLNRKREFINHFDFYNQDNFEAGYTTFFDIVEKKDIENTERTMYVMQLRDGKK